MRKRSFLKSLFAFTILIGLLAMPTLNFAEEMIQEWELVNPEGNVALLPMAKIQIKINPRPPTLEGKTVMLFANSKSNSDKFLERVGELLTKQVKNIKILKNWEVARETFMLSQHPDVSKKNAEKLASFKPDLVIGSQAD